MPTIPCESPSDSRRVITHTEFNASVELALLNIQQQQHCIMHFKFLSTTIKNQLVKIVIMWSVSQDESINVGRVYTILSYQGLRFAILTLGLTMILSSD